MCNISPGPSYYSQKAQVKLKLGLKSPKLLLPRKGGLPVSCWETRAKCYFLCVFM